MSKVRYDGLQADLFGGGVHCYTVTDADSPAYGFGLAFDEKPTDAQIEAAVREKEGQITQEKEAVL